jgi:hypothetical protein
MWSREGSAELIDTLPEPLGGRVARPAAAQRSFDLRSAGHAGSVPEADAPTERVARAGTCPAGRTSTGMWLGDRKCGREHECESGMVTVGLALPFDDEARRSTATRSPTMLLASARECT